MTKSRAGFTLLETLIAFVVLTSALTVDSACDRFAFATRRRARDTMDR